MPPFYTSDDEVRCTGEKCHICFPFQYRISFRTGKVFFVEDPLKLYMASEEVNYKGIQGAECGNSPDEM
jgi:hypothetical protein